MRYDYSTKSRTTLEQFRRHVTALRGIYYRMDTGTLTGRNSDATAEALDMHYDAARALLRADAATDANPICDYLDTHERFAASWNALERRYVGLYGGYSAKAAV